MEKTYTFYVTGMHCSACVLMTESELQDVPEITHAKTSLATNTAEVTGNFGDKHITDIAAELSNVLSKHGYSLSVEQSAKKKKWGEFKFAVPIAAVCIVLFVALQKLNIVNIVDTRSVTYGTSFLIGVIASLSTCLAVVGGLVLSMSATFAKEGDKIKPQLLFHAGRIGAFFVLGGAIGALGSIFILSTRASVILGFLIGGIMLLLGINLLDIFDGAKKFQPALPQWLSRRALGLSKINHRFTPLLVGVATFFLPCGFTQSMQIYTLSTHNFLTGGLTMLAFALGTLPVLALMSFSSLSIQKSSQSGIFFKTAGLVVILFALFNIINSLVVIGLIPPVFNF